MGGVSADKLNFLGKENKKLSKTEQSYMQGLLVLHFNCGKVLLKAFN